MAKLDVLSDADLVEAFRDLAIEEQWRLALQLEHLAEMDRRKLFFHYPSLRAYLVAEHGMEEWQAERRIRAARMLKRIPGIKIRLETGKLNLTLLELAQGCAYREKLSDSELGDLLEAISGMSCRAARREIATRYPRSAEELPQDRIRPLTGSHSEVTFVASEALLEKLEDIRGLVAHAHPGIGMAELIDLLATEYRTRHHPEEKAKRAKRAKEREERNQQRSESVEKTAAPRVPSPPPKGERRTPSSQLVHELTLQDGYQCSYLDPTTGKICGSKRALEIDHALPWSRGGKTELPNLRFRCVSHHRRISFLEFGESAKYFVRSGAPPLGASQVP